MLRFKKLTLENIGPYKGTQTVEFADGVTVMWGVNGSGKTQLIKAINFAFYGSYLNAAGEEMDSIDILNSEAYDDGRYDFSVELEMEYNDKDYVLTRQRKLKSDVKIPEKETDYIKYCFISTDGSIVSQESTEHILSGIMPQQISRFFLFNGELLEDYEKLLSEDSRVNTEIKEAIEDILGLPILMHGKNDVQAVFNIYAGEHERIGQNDRRTRSTANKIKTAKANIEVNRSELKEKQKSLTESKARREKLEGDLADNEDIRRLLEKIRGYEKDIKLKEEERKEALTDISERTTTAWTGLVSERAGMMLADTDKYLTALENKNNSHAANKKLIEEMQKAVKEHHCAVCDQGVDDSQADAILKRISEYEGGGLTPEEQDELMDLRKKSADLNYIIKKDSFNAEALEIMEKRLDSLDVDITNKRRSLDDAQKKLEKYGNRDDLDKKDKETNKELINCNAEIEILSEGIKAIKDTIEEEEGKLKKLEQKFREQSSGGSLEAAGKKKDLCEQILNIFTEGVDAYREKLRADVEIDATEFFVNIAEDKECVALKMNDNYGLSIVHKDGKLVSSRSSGYGHVVALCLIGALHKNAPLNGPIVMDSPLGRLDDEHHDNIVKAFPQMADQVVLLVHSRELNEQEAEHLLKGNLNMTYNLIRYSTFNTQITRRNR